MDVLIIETKTGKLAAKIPVIHQGMNYTRQNVSTSRDAWRCAVDDKTVEPNRRDEYSFQLVRPQMR